ncbi:MAG: ImmA/IrrE family metallo-endopeptidase [candidate division WOR-3 bacterium]
MPNNQSLRLLQQKLKEKLGITPQFLKEKILPDWWNNNLYKNPAGYSQALAYITRYTGIPYDNLLEPEYDLVARIPGDQVTVRFKKNSNLTDAELNHARFLVENVARVTNLIFKKPYQNTRFQAKDIRQAILGTGEKWVSFSALLNWCWQNNIPVIPATVFPRGVRKMTASVIYRDAKPVIVLSKDTKSSASQLFYLAHELGHLFLGHVHDGQSLIDEKVELADVQISQQVGDRNAEEIEADRFAVELLTGNAKNGNAEKEFLSDRNLTVQELVDQAYKLAPKMKIDPGVIAMNYAYHKDFFLISSAALKIIEQNTDAIEIMRSCLQRNIPDEGVIEEDVGFILRLSQG